MAPRSEHWLKLHQFHCDIIRGAKVLPGGKHDRDSCLACKEGSEAARVNNNGLPSLPCYLPNNFVPSFQGCEGSPSNVLPVQLGEMTGKFDSKVDNTLSILLRLMKKMMMDNHPLWTHYRSAYVTLWNGLKEARERIWINRIIFLDCFFEASNVGSFLFEYYEGMKLGDKIDELGMNGIIEVGPYKPFEICKLLFGILWKSHSEFRKRGYEHTNKAPKPPLELKDKMESVSEFLEMWKRVLQLLSGRLASIEDLKKTVCYGDLNKTCWGCYKVFTASDFFPSGVFPTYWRSFGPLFMFGNHLNFSYCGKCKFKVAFER